MHEASLAGGILRIVEDAARRDGFGRVKALRVEAGRLAGVEVRALRFALDAIAPGTVCLPHGWGHDVAGTRQRTAASTAGVNSVVTMSPTASLRP